MRGLSTQTSSPLPFKGGTRPAWGAASREEGPVELGSLAVHACAQRPHAAPAALSPCRWTSSMPTAAQRPSTRTLSQCPTSSCGTPPRGTCKYRACSTVKLSPVQPLACCRTGTRSAPMCSSLRLSCQVAKGTDCPRLAPWLFFSPRSGGKTVHKGMNGHHGLWAAHSSNVLISQ